MLNVTNPVGKDKSRRPKANIRWSKGNTAETIDVPDLYLAATTWGRCDRPASVADTFCDGGSFLDSLFDFCGAKLRNPFLMDAAGIVANLEQPRYDRRMIDRHRRGLLLKADKGLVGQ